jgi:hypothetical protein
MSTPEGVDLPVPSIEAAHEMGAHGGPAVESERLAFEAWMRGHCWALCATWTGTQYRSDAEQEGDVDPRAMATRRLWAAWRDRAALGVDAIRSLQQEVGALNTAANAARSLIHRYRTELAMVYACTSNLSTDGALNELDRVLGALNDALSPTVAPGGQPSEMSK